jgi:hypothetical protein
MHHQSPYVCRSDTSTYFRSRLNRDTSACIPRVAEQFQLASPVPARLFSEQGCNRCGMRPNILSLRDRCDHQQDAHCRRSRGSCMVASTGGAGVQLCQQLSKPRSRTTFALPVHPTEHVPNTPRLLGSGKIGAVELRSKSSDAKSFENFWTGSTGKHGSRRELIPVARRTKRENIYERSCHGRGIRN